MKTGVKIKQLGIGLLELMLSLAIIAILLVMAIRYYQSASNAQSINSAIDMINAVKSGVKNYMTSNIGSVEVPSVSKLAGSGYLPQTYKESATANPWGGVIGTTSAGSTGSCSDGGGTISPTFTICMDSVP